jgi:hypothetical protein
MRVAIRDPPSPRCRGSRHGMFLQGAARAGAGADAAAGGGSDGSSSRGAGGARSSGTARSQAAAGSTLEPFDGGAEPRGLADASADARPCAAAGGHARVSPADIDRTLARIGRLRAPRAPGGEKGPPRDGKSPPRDEHRRAPQAQFGVETRAAAPAAAAWGTPEGRAAVAAMAPAAAAMAPAAVLGGAGAVEISDGAGAPAALRRVLACVPPALRGEAVAAVPPHASRRPLRALPPTAPSRARAVSPPRKLGGRAWAARAEKSARGPLSCCCPPRVRPPLQRGASGFTIPPSSFPYGSPYRTKARPRTQQVAAAAREDNDGPSSEAEGCVEAALDRVLCRPSRCPPAPPIRTYRVRYVRTYRVRYIRTYRTHICPAAGPRGVTRARRGSAGTRTLR